MALRALIVGAGIGGLAAGIALKRAGWQVRVFERASNPRELGFALGLAPNAMAALGELEVAVVVEAFGPPSAELRHPDGRVIRRLEIAGIEKTGIVLRPVLHGALLTAIGSDSLALGCQAAGFEIKNGGVTLTLADGRTATGDVLVGADGIGSVIRRLLHPSESPPRQSSHYAFRGVAVDVGHHLGDLSAVWYFGDGFEAATVRASRTGVYWFVSLLEERVPAGPRDATSLLERCLDTLIPEEHFRAIAGATKPDDLRFEQLFDRDPIQAWGTGPVTLLGDAAHPMLPHTGQGAAQALEDAVALGLALGPAGNVAAALRRYERVRAARTRSIVKIGRRIARVTTTRNPAISYLRNAAVRNIPKALIVAAFQRGGRKDPHRELRPDSN